MRHWQLVAAVGWLVVAGALTFRDALVSDETAESVRGWNWTIAAWVAVGLVFWNLARWYHARSRRAAPPPLRPDRPAGGGYEYHPEFDFQKQDQPQINADERRSEHNP